MLTFACEYMFDILGLHRCELQVAADNVRAWKCYENVGFAREGVLRSCYFDRGEWKDCICMGLLEDEWREKRRKKIVSSS